jgi:Initiator Replication protein
MFNQLLQTAHDSGRMTEPDAEWEISLAALRRGSTKHESNDRIRLSLRRLRRTEVRVSYVSARTGLPRTMETHLLDFTDTDDVDSPTATVQFAFPKRLRVVLARSNRWGRIRCEISYAMTSKYAIALYEMVCLRANLDRCLEVIEMSKFRDLLGVPPGAYERADNFMRNVIAPALLEVNGLSDIGVQIEMVRKHPRASAHAVAITWLAQAGGRVPGRDSGAQPAEGRPHGAAQGPGRAARRGPRRARQCRGRRETGKDAGRGARETGGGRMIF